MTGLSDYDALGLAELIRRKQTSADELLSWAVASAEAVNRRLNCIAHTHYDEARAQISAGLGAGPFRGVPFIVKDLGIELAQTVTSSGSLAFGDRRASMDSELVARYKRAGLVIFAKSTTPELGLAFTTESKAFGLTRNPLGPGALGGRLVRRSGGGRRERHRPDGARIGRWRIDSSAGILQRSFRAQALARTDALRPRGNRALVRPGDRSRRYSQCARQRGASGCDLRHGVRITLHGTACSGRGFLAGLDQRSARLRIALMLDAPGGTPIDPACIEAARDAARLCESLGHHVEEAAPALDADALTAGFLACIMTAVAQALRDRGAERGRPVGAEEVETVTWITRSKGARRARSRSRMRISPSKLPPSPCHDS